MKCRRAKTLAAIVLAVLCSAGGVRAQPKLTPVPIQQVRIDDPFWSPKRDVWRKVTIADCFDKFEKDGALTNFDKVRDGIGGAHGGPQWYDGLLYEMITGSADFLSEARDLQLEARIDGYIERIAAAAAKDPDGYVNTYTQLKEPSHRWGMNGGDDREQHDLYNAGCMVEAGVHYYRATGKTKLLAAAARLANHMCDLMGPPPKQNIVPGHALGEAALVELHDLFKEHPELKQRMPFAVDESRYLALAQFWIDNRGRHEGRKSFGAYDQDDRPVVEQQTIEGHAVRATLMANGLTALASAAHRDDYRTAAHRLWDNMTERRMYVTGGVGAVAGDEKFGDDYFLPSNGYLETCAAVGAGFFHHRMNLDSGDARGADELERVLFNSALCGVSLGGDRYFYENPLESGKNRRRWAWHACPCCPPMFLKLMGAVPGAIYAMDATGVYVNQYVGSQMKTKVDAGDVAIRQSSKYPWQGDVRLTVDSNKASEFDLHLRVPAWCEKATSDDELYTPLGRPQSGAFVVKVNGQPADIEIANGYATIHRNWSRGDTVDISMAMPARRIAANPKVEAAAGKVALSRGPIVYCLESVDNDGHVKNLSLPEASELRMVYRPDLLGGVTVIRAQGMASFAGAAEAKPIELTAIPYYANANRGPVSMCVWIPRSPAAAAPISVADSATAAASHTNPSDTLAALNDGRAPKSSDDETLPRFTWWDHRGTTEWVQYTFDCPTRLSGTSVYWWDERRVGRHCRVPASWRLTFRTAAGKWTDVRGVSSYGTEIDQFNAVKFDPIEAAAIRIEAKLQPQWSGGILEWRLDESPPGDQRKDAKGSQSSGGAQP